MFKCTDCEDKYEQLPDLISHIEEEHEECIPKDQSVEQYYYMSKTGKTHGSCVVCKGKTGWNEVTKKYHRFCKNPNCKEKYRETFKNRMIGTYGKVSLLNDPEHQKKMLANRSISGRYKWSDGVEFVYTGSYELDFLKFLDKFMGFDSSDIMAPSPHTYYYMFNGEKKFYMPDFFIPSLNLEIEIKDGGDNANMHHKIQAVDKVKEKLKDQVLQSQKEFSYIKVVNKQYDNFFDCLMAMKNGIAETGKMPQIFDLADSKGVVIKGPVMESALAGYDDFDEEFVLELLQSVDVPEVVDMIMEATTATEKFKEVAKNYRDFLALDTNDILRDIDKFASEHDYDCAYHDVDKYLKEQGIINTPIRTPGFTSANTGNLYLNILESFITTGYDHECIKGVEDKFKESIRCNGTPEMIEVYDRDSRLGTYYLKMLAGKLDKERLVISDVCKRFEDIVTEARYQVEGKDAYPVYVILTHTGTVLSNIIKKVTDAPFSHASIAFDPYLNDMYSFGRKYAKNPLIGRFVREDLSAGLLKDVIDTAEYAMYVTFVEKDQLDAMRARLEYFKNNAEGFKYSFKGLINHKRGIESDSVNEFFCSQFVDHILTAGRQYFEKHSSMVQPIDFANHKDFYLVSKGTLRTYDPDQTVDTVEHISKKARFTRAGKGTPVVYLGLTQEEAAQRKVVRLENGKSHMLVQKNLPELKYAIKTGDVSPNITHYTVMMLADLKRMAKVMKVDNGFLVETGVDIPIKNVNLLS